MFSPLSPFFSLASAHSAIPRKPVSASLRLEKELGAAAAAAAAASFTAPSAFTFVPSTVYHIVVVVVVIPDSSKEGADYS